MKKFISLTILIIVSSCSNPELNSPKNNNIELPNNLRQIQVDQLYKSDTCFAENNNYSSRRYLTKTNLESDFTYEADLFSDQNCEQNMPTILMTMRYSFKLVSFKDSLVSNFTEVSFNQISLELMIHDSTTLDLYNSQNILGGSFQIGKFKDISGMGLNYPNNGNITTHELSFRDGLIIFDQEIFR